MAANKKAVQVRIDTVTASQAGHQRAHDLRIGPQPEYVDAARSHLNRILIEPLPGVQLREICEARRGQRATKRAMKSNAAVGVSGIITFGHEAQPIFAALAPDDQDRAYREVAEAVADRIGTTLTGLVIHRDEAADHAHFQLPGFTLDGKPVSQVAKREALRDMQTLAAAIMQRYAPGIERGKSRFQRIAEGESYADTIHKSATDMRERLPREIKAAEADRDQRRSQAEEAREVMWANIESAGKAEQAKREAETEKNKRQRERDQIVVELGRLRLAADQEAERLRVNQERADKAAAKADGEDTRAEKARKNAAIYERRAKEAQEALDSLNERLRAVQEALSSLDSLLAEKEALTASLEPLRAAVAARDAHEAAERDREVQERQAAEDAGRFAALRTLFSATDLRSTRFGPLAAWTALEHTEAAGVRSYLDAKDTDGPAEIRQQLEQLDPRSFHEVVTLSQANPSLDAYSHVGYAVREASSWGNLMERLDNWGQKLAAKISKTLTAASFIFKPVPPPPEAKLAEKVSPELRAALRKLNQGPER